MVRLPQVLRRLLIPIGAISAVLLLNGKEEYLTAAISAIVVVGFRKLRSLPVLTSMILFPLAEYIVVTRENPMWSYKGTNDIPAYLVPLWGCAAVFIVDMADASRPL